MVGDGDGDDVWERDESGDDDDDAWYGDVGGDEGGVFDFVMVNDIDIVRDGVDFTIFLCSLLNNISNIS